jgi:hypothetical protein
LYESKTKSSAAQRESEGIEVPKSDARASRTNAVKNNAAGGKGPCGGHAGEAGKREGMAGKSGPNDPGGRGWGNYFRTRNAAKRFNQLDTYVWRPLKSLRVKRKGRHLRPGEVERWSRDSSHELGLHRPRGTVRYPKQSFLPFRKAA